MALPSSGTLSLAQIQTEFGGSNPISLSEYYRGGPYVTTNNTGVPTSGSISISNFYGAVKQFAFTVSSNLSTPQNLRSLALAAGWNGSDNVLATNTGKISSDTTGTPALTINGSFPNGLIFVNSGYIVGMGGAGGSIYANGSAGGPAVAVSTALSITNNGVFAGGGGGGGSGQPFGWCGTDLTGPGGGGASGFTPSPSGGCNYNACSSGSSLDGATGFYSNPGSGGQPYICGVPGTLGGTGGTWGNAGGSPYYSGGAAGAALTGTSYVTWLATGTRYGPVS